MAWECNYLDYQLRDLGLERGDTVMVHSSFRSIGIRCPETIIDSLLRCIGTTGTLLMPALSYNQLPPNTHDNLTTPGCVGFLAEYFRQREGSMRSLHPTHSVCGYGNRAIEILMDHIQDSTPCGHHSPFNKILQTSAKILMLGCGTRPNTAMHAIEEHVCPPYLFGPIVDYTITDAHGCNFSKAYVTHGFKGYTQRYDRIECILSDHGLQAGNFGNAKSYLINTEDLLREVSHKLKSNCFYFVDAK